MDNCMNILTISPDVPPYKGGISRLVGLLKSGLERLGHKVTLVHPIFRVKEFKFSTIPFRRYRDKYDLIHLNGPTPFLSDLTLVANGKSRIVYTHHAEVSWLSEGISRIYRNFHRFLARRAQYIIVHSYDYAKLFEKACARVVRMPCSFEPQNNFRIEQKPNSFTVLYVGQFRPFKGIDILINVASVLKDVKFVLVGEGYLRKNLLVMAEGLNNVKFTGLVSDGELKRLYRSAHVVCLPSVNTTEGYGLVLIEGALYGCVPIASNLIGVRENVSQLEGLLFEKGSFVSLSKKIAMLADNRELWADLAMKSHNAACDYVNTYTPEWYVKKHEEIFQECLAPDCARATTETLLAT